jgi:hypothetical protein
VYKVSVNVRKPQVFQRFGDRLVDFARPVHIVPYFRRDKKLFALYSTGAESFVKDLAYQSFVAINGRAVKKAVACANRAANRRGYFGRAVSV